MYNIALVLYSPNAENIFSEKKKKNNGPWAIPQKHTLNGCKSYNFNIAFIKFKTSHRIVSTELKIKQSLQIKKLTSLNSRVFDLVPVNQRLVRWTAQWSRAPGCLRQQDIILKCRHQTRPDQTSISLTQFQNLLMFTFSQHLVGGGTRTFYTFVIQGDLFHWYPPNFSTKKNTAKQPITAQDLLEQQL